jgi:hypothetical protein
LKDGWRFSQIFPLSTGDPSGFTISSISWIRRQSPGKMSDIGRYAKGKDNVPPPPAWDRAFEIEVSAAGRAGTPGEGGTVGALLTGPDGGFIAGGDILMDGRVTAAYWYGEPAPR